MTFPRGFHVCAKLQQDFHKLASNNDQNRIHSQRPLIKVHQEISEKKKNEIITFQLSFFESRKQILFVHHYSARTKSLVHVTYYI